MDNLNPTPAPAQAPQQVKGKPFAIVAFVFGLLALLFLASAFFTKIELDTALRLAHDMSNSTTQYTILNEDILRLTIKVLLVMSIIAAAVSDALVAGAYVGHSKNVKNGNPVKFVLVFAVVATVAANLGLIISLIVLL